MLNGIIRLIILGVLAIVAISVMFLVIHIAVRLVILGALVVGILWLINSFKKNGGNTQS